MKNGKPKVAIVHDWLVAYAGADRVVDCMRNCRTYRRHAES